MAGLTNYQLGQSTAIVDERTTPDVKPQKHRNRAGVVPDFIPGPRRQALIDAGLNNPPKRSQFENGRAAYEQTIRSQDANRAHAVDIAKAKLEKLNVADACEFIAKQPPRVQELYLVAEEQGQARRSILTRFPRAGKAARGEGSNAALDAQVQGWKDKKRELQHARHAPVAVEEADEAQLEALAQSVADDDGMAQPEENEDDLQA